MSLATIFCLKATGDVFLTMSVAFAPWFEEGHATTTLTQGGHVNVDVV